MIANIKTADRLAAKILIYVSKLRFWRLRKPPMISGQALQLALSEQTHVHKHTLSTL